MSSRAALPTPAAASSSLGQKVPSKKIASASRRARCTAGDGAATDGNQATVRAARARRARGSRRCRADGAHAATSCAGAASRRRHRLERERAAVDGERARRARARASGCGRRSDRACAGPRCARRRRGAPPRWRRAPAAHSRSENSPSQASTSPFGSATAATGERRPPARGHSSGVRSSCARTSGDAPSSSQRSPSADTASDACVRGGRRAPLRTPSHWRQPQFHCGKPPPAAEPSTRTRISLRRGRARDRILPIAAVVWLVGADLGVHVDLRSASGSPRHRSLLGGCPVYRQRAATPIRRRPEEIGDQRPSARPHGPRQVGIGASTLRATRSITDTSFDGPLAV